VKNLKQRFEKKSFNLQNVNGTQNLFTCNIPRGDDVKLRADGASGRF